MSELTNEELRTEIAKAKGYEPLHGGLMRTDWIGTVTDGHWHVVVTPKWSTDITAAWGLVEEMIKDKLSEVYLCTLEGYSSARMMRDTNGKKINSVEMVASGIADNMPRAICLAWLKWKEGTK